MYAGYICVSRGKFVQNENYIAKTKSKLKRREIERESFNATCITPRMSYKQHLCMVQTLFLLQNSGCTTWIKFDIHEKGGGEGGEVGWQATTPDGYSVLDILQTRHLDCPRCNLKHPGFPGIRALSLVWQIGSMVIPQM